MTNPEDHYAELNDLHARTNKDLHREAQMCAMFPELYISLHALVTALKKDLPKTAELFEPILERARKLL